MGNLVSNAIKYSDPGGRVRVTLRRAESADGAHAALEVADQGIGISAEDRPRVFEEFFRSIDPRVRERPGTGLGLAIVDRAVARHGGRIAVESSPADGTRVCVTLPLAD
jgi:signal transduction histidine kinase